MGASLQCELRRAASFALPDLAEGSSAHMHAHLRDMLLRAAHPAFTPHPLPAQSTPGPSARSRRCPVDAPSPHHPCPNAPPALSPPDIID